MKITVSSIKETFNRISDADVNVRKPLLWGFFLATSSIAHLDAMISNIRAWGFEYVGKWEDKNGYRIHFEKIDIHTPESLFDVCKKFAELEREYKDVVFDGYDVGNPNKDLPITDVK